MSDNQKLIEDFQRAFKYSRFKERRTFGDARNDAITAACALHGGTSIAPGSGTICGIRLDLTSN
jgi:hypothetical protein